MSVLVGRPAPEFTASAVFDGKITEGFSLNDYKGKYVIFFFYPYDFTFVCPTELHAFQEKLGEFKKRNAELIACSVDSPYSHFAWLNTPKEKGGIQGVTYPLVSDITKEISWKYQVMKETEVGYNGECAYRGLFLIDKEGVIRHMLINDLPLGRSVDEALRMLDALIFHEVNGEVCPANWKSGEKSMKPDQEGLEKYFSK